MNTYRAFGLIIASELTLQELITVEAQTHDLVIKTGKVPDDIEGQSIRLSNKVISNDKLLLDIAKVCKYYVADGNLIILEPYENSSYEEMKLYLFGTCMGAILLQRKMLPLHGSCVNINGTGLLLTGKSGAGKSTIAATLFNKGYKMITDDVAAVKVHERMDSIVYPSYPSQKLWEDAINRMDRQEHKMSLIRISDSFEKYSIKSHMYFDETPIPLKVIIEIVPSDTETIEIEEITGINKINLVMKNTYRRRFVKAMNLREWHFCQCVNTSNMVKMYRIKRPKDRYLENEIAAIIMEKLI